MSLRKASKPMTLEQRLTAEDLQPLKIQPLVTIFEDRVVPEKPNCVKDMEMDDEREFQIGWTWRRGKRTGRKRYTA